MHLRIKTEPFTARADATVYIHMPDFLSHIWHRSQTYNYCSSSKRDIIGSDEKIQIIFGTVCAA